MFINDLPLLQPGSTEYHSIPYEIQLSKSQTLPPEILHVIFSHLEPKKLEQCSLVCKSWYNTAKTKFYETVFINADNDLSDVAQFLSTYGPLVKHIRFEATSRNMHVFTQGTLILLLGLCLNLETVKSNNEQLGDSLSHIIGVLSVTLKKVHQIPQPTRWSRHYQACLDLRKTILSEVHLDHSQISMSLINTLQELPKLTSLILRTPMISLFQLDSVLTTCPKLKYLSISYEFIRIIQQTNFEFILKDNHPLQKLDLTSIPDRGFTISNIWSILSRLKALQSVTLNINVGRSGYSPTGNVFDIIQIIRLMDNFENGKLVVSLNYWPLEGRKITSSESSFLAENVKRIAAELQQIHKNQTNGWKNEVHVALISNINGTECFNYKTFASLKKRELFFKLAAFAPHCRLQQLSYSTDSFHIEIKQEQPHTARYSDSLIPTLLHQQSLVRSFTMTSGYLLQAVSRSIVNTGLRELNLSNTYCSPDFFNSIAHSFPNLEVLRLSPDVLKTIYTEELYIFMPNSRLKHLVVDLTNYSNAYNGGLPYSVVFGLSLKLTRQTDPLLYQLVHNTFPTISDCNPLLYTLNVSIADLESLLFKINCKTIISWSQ